MKSWHLGVVALVFLTGMAQAQAPASVKFEFDRPGMEIPHWTITLDVHGDGAYEEQPAGDAAPFKQALHVSAETIKRLNAGATQAATKNCETNLKNVAKTGKKTLTYLSVSGDVVGQCTYNFSDDAGVKGVTDGFLALQETVEEGKRLAFKHRFDRLGLDAEIDVLVGLVKDGRAIELGNISAILRSIIGDMDVLQRVRTKAENLAQQQHVTL